MIALIERLLASQHAYVSGGNVYFDVAAFPAYGRLSGNYNRNALREAVRVETDPHKRHAQDFALWKAAEPGRIVKWESPWGSGFPGWHIECSAMAMTYLGETFDIHTGGVDNIFPHHEDEIAQSEAATGKSFARHWVHAQHLLTDGVKMAKSAGNVYTLSDLIARGFAPSDFRYLCLTVHYRHQLNFTFASLRAARNGLDHLRDRIWQLMYEAVDMRKPPATATKFTLDNMEHWRTRFWSAIRADLGLPRALATLWAMLATNELNARQKLMLIGEWDIMLGLELLTTARPWRETSGAPEEVRALLRQRAQARKRKAYVHADMLRKRIYALGFETRDTIDGARIRPVFVPDALVDAISTPDQVPSLLDKPNIVDFSVLLYATFWLDDLRRCIESLLNSAENVSLEILVVDAGANQSGLMWLTNRSLEDNRIRVIRADHVMGEAEARNVAIRQSRGEYCVVMDTSVELIGAIWEQLRHALCQPHVALAGAYGLITHDLRQFEESDGPDVDALQGYLMAFRRAAVRRVGLMDPRYRFYRNLDLDYSFTLRQKGLKNATTAPDRAVVVTLPVVRHEHRIWESLSEEERAKQSKQNFDMFLRKWHHYTHLIDSSPATIADKPND
jgi:cysteinyl-tRNA synthetase